MVKVKTPSRDFISSPSLGIIMPHQLSLLITDIALIQMSQWQMSIHLDTQYCILWGLRGWTDGSALETAEQTHFIKH